MPDATRIRRGAVGLASLVVLATAAGAAAPPKTLLWKVVSPHRTLYVAGITELLSSSDYPLPAPITAAFAKSNELILEGDPAPNADSVQALVRSLGMLPSGGQLDDLLDPGQQRLVDSAFTQLGVPLASVRPLQPWLATLVMTQAGSKKLGLDADMFEDAYFYRKAKARGMRVTPLESGPDQIRLFAGLPEAQQIAWLMFEANDAPRLAGERSKTLRLWRAGDAAGLAAMQRKSFTGYDSLYALLVTNRNRTWLRVLEDRLGHVGKPVFVAVGAGHLVGPGNLIAALRAAGYRVTQM